MAQTTSSHDEDLTPPGSELPLSVNPFQVLIDPQGASKKAEVAARVGAESRRVYRPVERMFAGAPKKLFDVYTEQGGELVQVMEPLRPSGLSDIDGLGESALQH